MIRRIRVKKLFFIRLISIACYVLSIVFMFIKKDGLYDIGRTFCVIGSIITIVVCAYDLYHIRKRKNKK